jgi:hypothetical protein
MTDTPLLEGQATESNGRSALELKLLGNMSVLLGNVGTYGICKFCGERVVWIKHRNGVNAPYDTPTGSNHMGTCAKPEGRIK